MVFLWVRLWPIADFRGGHLNAFLPTAFEAIADIRNSYSSGVDSFQQVFRGSALRLPVLTTAACSEI